MVKIDGGDMTVMCSDIFPAHLRITQKTNPPEHANIKESLPLWQGREYPPMFAMKMKKCMGMMPIQAIKKKKKKPLMVFQRYKKHQNKHTKKKGKNIWDL